MDVNEQGQRFSFAYVHAVASVTGYAVDEKRTDDDSVDLTICRRGGAGTARSPKLDLQVKHWRQGSFPPEADTLSYPLKVKNHNELCGDGFQTPRILVVVLDPVEIDDWVHQTDSQLALRHCGYWLSLRERQPSDNEETVTVHLARTQVFSTESLRTLMDISGNGGAP